jgi:hypothetical protein
VLRVSEDVKGRGVWIGRVTIEKILLDFLEHHVTHLHDPSNTLIGTVPSTICLKYLLCDASSDDRALSPPTEKESKGSWQTIQKPPSVIHTDSNPEDTREHAGSDVGTARGISPRFRGKLGSKHKRPANFSVLNVRRDTPPSDTVGVRSNARLGSEASFLTGKAFISKGSPVSSAVCISQERVSSPLSPMSNGSLSLHSFSHLDDVAYLQQLLLRWDLLSEHSDLVQKEIAAYANAMRQTYKHNAGELLVVHTHTIPLPHRFSFFLSLSLSIYLSLAV